MIRLIFECNDYSEQAEASIDITEGANASAPVAGSDEEEYQWWCLDRHKSKLRQQQRPRRLRKIRKGQQSKRIKLEKPNPLQPLHLQLQQPKPKRF